MQKPRCVLYILSLLFHILLLLLSTMRQYETIWSKLKRLPAKEAAEVGVSVAASRALHGRILKAVVKEKWKDIAFKILLDDKRAVLRHSQNHAILTFYLDYTYGQDDF